MTNRHLAPTAVIVASFMMAATIAIPAFAASTGGWTTAGTGGSATVSGVTVTMTLSGGNAATTETLVNQPTFYNNPHAGGNPANTAAIAIWPRPFGTTRTFTVTFSKPVDNPILHIDRLGGTSGGASSARLNLTGSSPAGVTMSALATNNNGANGLIVTAGSLRSSNTGTVSSTCSANSTAGCGSVLMTGQGVTSLTFTVNWEYISNNNTGDQFEFVVSAPETRVIIRKQSTGGTRNFTYSGTNGVGAFNLDTGAANPATSATFTVTNNGQPITVTESNLGSFTLDSVSCVDNLSNPVTSSLAGTTMTIAAADYTVGRTITCTFQNSLPADMQPNLAGLPTAAEVGVAFSGTVLCTNNGPATATSATCSVAGLPAGVSVTSCAPTPPVTVANGASIACSVSGTPTTAGTTSVVVTTGATNDNNGGTGTGGNNQVSQNLTVHESSVETTKTASFDITSGRSATLGDAGDVITYTISVRNTGTSTLTSVTATDNLTRLGGGALTLDGPVTPASHASVAPGATVQFTVSYTLVQADVDAGGVSNTATGSAQTPVGTSVSDPIDAPVITNVAPAPELSVTKVADDDTLREAGDVVTYTYTVTNEGNVTINNVDLSDAHNGNGPAPSPLGESLTTDVAPPGDSTDVTANNGVWSVLRPGDTVTMTGTYTVTQADVDLLQ